MIILKIITTYFLNIIILFSVSAKAQNKFLLGERNKKIIEGILNYQIDNLKICEYKNNFKLIIYAKDVYIFNLSLDTHVKLGISDHFSLSSDCKQIATAYSDGNIVDVYDTEIGMKLHSLSFNEHRLIGSIFFWEKEGSLIVYAKTYNSDQADPTLFKIQNGKIIQRLPLPFNIAAYANALDGRRYLIGNTHLNERDKPTGVSSKMLVYYKGKIKEVKPHDLDRRYKYKEILDTQDKLYYVRTPVETYNYSQIVVYDKKSGNIVDTFLGTNLNLTLTGDVLYLKPVASTEHELVRYDPKTKQHEVKVKAFSGSVKFYDFSENFIFSLSDKLSKVVISQVPLLGKSSSNKILVHGPESDLKFSRRFAHNKKNGIDLPYLLIRKKGVEEKGTIIYVHGGSPSSMGSLEEGNRNRPELLIPFLEDGYTLAIALYHGDDIRYLGNYLNIEPDQARDVRSYFKNESDDLLALESSIRSKSNLPIIWYGHSNGSSTLNAYLTQKKELVQANCAISASGLWDYTLSTKTNNADIDTWFVSKYGDPGPQTSITDHGEGYVITSPNARRARNYDEALELLGTLIKEGDEDPVVFYNPGFKEFSLRNPVDHLGSIKIPVFAFAGTNDIFFNNEVKHLNKIVHEKKIRHIKIKEYEGSEHLIDLQDINFKEVVRDIRLFIQQHCQ